MFSTRGSKILAGFGALGLVGAGLLGLTSSSSPKTDPESSADHVGLLNPRQGNDSNSQDIQNSSSTKLEMPTSSVPKLETEGGGGALSELSAPGMKVAARTALDAMRDARPMSDEFIAAMSSDLYTGEWFRDLYAQYGPTTLEDQWKFAIEDGGSSKVGSLKDAISEFGLSDLVSKDLQELIASTVASNPDATLKELFKEEMPDAADLPKSIQDTETLLTWNHLLFDLLCAAPSSAEEGGAFAPMFYQTLVIVQAENPNMLMVSNLGQVSELVESARTKRLSGEDISPDDYRELFRAIGYLGDADCFKLRFERASSPADQICLLFMLAGEHQRLSVGF